MLTVIHPNHDPEEDADGRQVISLRRLDPELLGIGHMGHSLIPIVAPRLSLANTAAIGGVLTSAL
jgi:hypothetical protein